MSHEWFAGAGRRAAVAAERAKAVAAFDAAVRKYRKKLIDEAEGADLGMKLVKSLTAIELRANKAEIRDDRETADRCEEVLRSLRKERRTAEEAGAKARARAREAELRRLEDARLDGESRTNSATRQYLKELHATRR